jgi:hypothetical protein
LKRFACCEHQVVEGADAGEEGLYRLGISEVHGVAFGVGESVQGLLHAGLLAGGDNDGRPFP